MASMQWICSSCAGQTEKLSRGPGFKYYLAVGPMLLPRPAFSSLLRTCPRVVGLAGGLVCSASALAIAVGVHVWLLKLLEGLLVLSTAMQDLHTSTHNPPHSSLWQL